MTDHHDADLGPHPNVNQEPLRTGNPPDTQADREDVAFSPPTWAVDRMTAGVIMLIIAAVIVAVGVFTAGFLLS